MLISGGCLIGNGIGGQDIAIYIGGQKLSFDTPPLNKEGRIFVPIRYIAEYFGGEVEWDPENQIVNVRNGSSFVSLQIGFKFAGVNGAVKVLDVRLSSTVAGLTCLYDLSVKHWAKKSGGMTKTEWCTSKQALSPTHHSSCEHWNSYCERS